MISIIIPNYNHSQYLAERIETLLCQEEEYLNFIVLDDASSDCSVDIINSYISKINRIDFVRNEFNSGSTYSQWNHGVSRSQTNLLNIAESDDSSSPNLLSVLKKKILEDEKIVLSFCRSELIDADSNKIGIWEYDDPIFDSDFIMDGLEFIEKYLIYKNVIPNASSVLFKKDKYLLVGSANIDLKTNGDWLIWMKILCHGKVAYTVQTLNRFRKHQNSVTTRFCKQIDKIYKEKYSLSLRLEFRKYLKSLSGKEFDKIKLINENHISYEYGHKSIYLLKNRNIYKSLICLSKSLFTGSIKTYFLKKYFLDIYNNLFQKQ